MPEVRCLSVSHDPTVLSSDGAVGLLAGVDGQNSEQRGRQPGGHPSSGQQPPGEHRAEREDGGNLMRRPEVDRPVGQDERYEQDGNADDQQRDQPARWAQQPSQADAERPPRQDQPGQVHQRGRHLQTRRHPDEVGPEYSQR
jgi:hypothetical protein